MNQLAWTLPVVTRTAAALERCQRPGAQRGISNDLAIAGPLMRDFRKRTTSAVRSATVPNCADLRSLRDESVATPSTLYWVDVIYFSYRPLNKRSLPRRAPPKKTSRHSPLPATLEKPE